MKGAFASFLHFFPLSAIKVISKLIQIPYKFPFDAGTLPLRLLTDFEVSFQDQPCNLTHLSQLRQADATSHAIVTGTVVLEGGTGDKVRLSSPEPVIDWVLEYPSAGKGNPTDDPMHQRGLSHKPHIAVWVITPQAWYKLLEPSQKYSPVFEEAIKGPVLAAAVLEQLASRTADSGDTEDLQTLIESVAASLPSPDPHRRRTLVSREAKEFALRQVETKLGRRKPPRAKLTKKRRRTASLTAGSRGRKRGPFSTTHAVSGDGETLTSTDGVKAVHPTAMSYKESVEEIDEVSDEDMPEDFEVSDIDEDASIEDLLARRKLEWRRWKYWTRRDVIERRLAREESSRKKEERQADTARGPPPPPTFNFRVPDGCVPDLLMVWDFCQTFADVLGLNPFSLRALEACIAPGPHISDRVKSLPPASHLPSLPRLPSPLKTEPSPAVKEETVKLATNSAPKPGKSLNSNFKDEKGTGDQPRTNKVGRPRGRPRKRDSEKEQGLEKQSRGTEEASESDGKTGKVQQPPMVASPPNPTPPVPLDPMAAAIAAARDAYVSMLRDKYGVPPSEVMSPFGPLVPAVDFDHAGSALLLKELAGSLFSLLQLDRAAQGAAQQGDIPAVVTAWPEQLSALAWNFQHASVQTKNAALKLAYSEWLDLSVEERMIVLVAAVEAALETETIIAEVNRRVEAMAASGNRAGGPDSGGAEDEEDDAGGGLGLAAAAAATATAATAAGSGTGPDVIDSPLDRWERWCKAQNLGVRRAVGTDFRGRRYRVLGGREGAFTLFCETPSPSPKLKSSWGMYQGKEAIHELTAWLRRCTIRCEASLIAVLSSAPFPLGVPRPTQTRITTSSNSKSISPVLHGMFNIQDGKQDAQMAPKLLALAIESLLACVPYWFKGWMAIRRVRAILELASSAQFARDAARALLETELILTVEKKVDEEWVDVWQAPWRRGIVGVSDPKELLLYAAALQTHVQYRGEVIPRPAFLKFAADANCTLTVPGLGDEVVVLRTGLLRHVDECVKIIKGGGDRPDPATRELPPKVKASSMEEVMRRWETARQGFATGLRPVGRYGVIGIAYRRHLVEEELLDGIEGEAKSELGPLPPRVPVAWLLLRPARFGPPDQLPAADVVLPLPALPSLPDYLIPLSEYVRRTRVSWKPGDRCKTFVGGKMSLKTMKKLKSGGTYRRGQVVAVEQTSAAQDNETRDTVDPWESVTVKWDNTAVFVPIDQPEDALMQSLSPWDLEIDPEEEKKRVEEARKHAQAAARAARARAGMRRSADDPEADAQAATWAEEDAKLAEVVAIGDRAAELLRMHGEVGDGGDGGDGGRLKDKDKDKDKIGSKEREEVVFNEVAHGRAAQMEHQALLASLGAPAMFVAAAAAAGTLTLPLSPGMGVFPRLQPR